MAYVPIPYIFPLLKIYFTPIKGEHGPLCILAIPVTVVQLGFVNGGQSKGVKWPRRRRVWEGDWQFVSENDISCTLNDIIRGLVMWSDIYQSPTPPFFWTIILLQSRGGGMAPCALSYASDGGAARICQRGAKAREQGEGVHGRWFPPPTVGRIFKICVWKRHFLAH